MIKLDDVLLGMESGFQDNQSYYNKKKDEIVNINFNYIHKYERKLLNEYLMLCSEWEKAEISEAVYFYEHEDEYISLPTSFDIHEHQLMVQFAQNLTIKDMTDNLLNKLRSKGAFRKFKDALISYGIEEAWFKYRDECFSNIEKTWCEEHRIALEEE